MTYEGNPNSAGDGSIDEMVWEADKIRPMEAGFNLVESAGFFRSQGNNSSQLRFKLLT